MHQFSYVYVLTSSDNDLYYEQFLLSITSFRRYNPYSHLTVLVDEKTKQGLIGKRSAYEKMVSEIILVPVPGEFSQKEASRWIKTSIRSHIFGDFMFIDCDTIITGDITHDFESTMQIGTVLDTHVPLSMHHLKDDFIKQKSASGFSDQFVFSNYYNSGILFCRDTSATHAFFNKWHELWLESNRHGISADQPSFNQANYELGDLITELPGEWNCQIAFNGLPFFHKAKIIHYYATSIVSFEPAYMLASPHILSSIKDTGNLTPEIAKMLDNPKSAFMEKSRIVADEVVLDILDSAYFQKLLWLRRGHERLFFWLNNIISRIKKPRGTKKREKNPH